MLPLSALLLGAFSAKSWPKRCQLQPSFSFGCLGNWERQEEHLGAGRTLSEKQSFGVTGLRGHRLTCFPSLPLFVPVSQSVVSMVESTLPGTGSRQKGGGGRFCFSGTSQHRAFYTLGGPCTS